MANITYQLNYFANVKYLYKINVLVEISPYSVRLITGHGAGWSLHISAVNLANWRLETLFYCINYNLHTLGVAMVFVLHIQP